jgi:hypothetical protein
MMIRERALFYVNLLDNKSEYFQEQSTETDDLKDYMFDQSQMVDIDALEAFVSENREALIGDEDDDSFCIDLAMTKGPGASQVNKYKKEAEEQAAA